MGLKAIENREDLIYQLHVLSRLSSYWQRGVFPAVQSDEQDTADQQETPEAPGTPGGGPGRRL